MQAGSLTVHTPQEDGHKDGWREKGADISSRLMSLCCNVESLDSIVFVTDSDHENLQAPHPLLCIPPFYTSPPTLPPLRLYIM